MTVRLLVIAASVIGLASCGQGGPSGEEPSGPIRTVQPDGANAVNTTGEATAVEAGDLPRPNEGLRFVGNWAANHQSCESAAWQFTETTLRTPAGSACSFDRVTEVPGGYDIRATCTAEGPPTSDTLKIRFAESAKAMLFESQTIAGNGLVFCGRDA
ncbi:MAG TPA: hypothetical protein VFU80_03075 [Sphingomicrobium sp.]|nr:hypothetical protein [Sphingomicrobium sp.]